MRHVARDIRRLELKSDVALTPLSRTAKKCWVTNFGPGEANQMPDEQRTAPSSRRRAASVALPFTVYSALLLGILCAVVVHLMPPQTPEERQNVLHVHRVVKNLVIAQKLVSKQLPLSPTAWSNDYLCGAIGRGVWCAQGLVDVVSPTGQQATLGWRIIFIPETSESLYLNVGRIEEGDYYSALNRAGITGIPWRNP